jgi:hypothetical protein
MGSLFLSAWMVRLKSRAERQQSARTQKLVAPGSEAATGMRSQRTRPPRRDKGKHRQLHDEAVKQVTEAAQEIMRANVEKAKTGSLTHTRWLFSLMEALQEQEEQSPARASRKSLAEMLIKQLEDKQ